MSRLAITQLTCGYDGQTILQDLHLALEQDEIVCLLGASGCGKTTLLKAIAGLLPISDGQICLAGKDLSQTPLEQRQIGLIFQDYALFPHLTVAENILFGLQQKSRQQQQTVLNKMTELVHLQGLEQRYPHQLSGGQQQRVAIARALACEPKLLLLDEPFSNIDSQVRYQLIEEIRAILKQQQVPAIFVTHSKEEAFVFADKLALMDKGKIVQFGDALSLYQQPNSRFVAEFLGNVNYLPCQIQQQQLKTVFGYLPLIKTYYADQRPVQEGDCACLLFRPEEIEIQSKVSQPLPPLSTLAIIQQRIFLGSHYRYYVKLANSDKTTSTLLVQSATMLPIGSKVMLTFQLQQLVLFSNQDIDAK
ncbi:ABC transporter [Gallibacterium salpingitidis]|uniref:ABC transporter ATP-binding protein n=1 Tax=Gallibacterium salpingitidis TaxID=505341 RepID=UPI000805D832|nr:ABC transporter ATP-binding protein [Gallibacterium salpingitidis]OBX08201.1 ABC transporter [Gallibacterium salpingitidis]